MKKILVTGGAGFIGSHLTDELLKREYNVFVLDKNTPKYPNKKARYIKADICRPLNKILSYKFDIIFHLAAAVGSGLSMADPKEFIRTNSLGTTNLLEAMRTCGKYAKIIVISSATVYGEATYKCNKHGVFYPDFRSLNQLKTKEWELKCPKCQKNMEAVAIKEDRPLNPGSIYGQSKLDQEIICRLLGRAWDFPVVAFRPFGVFGPRQSLGNPYTGVLALFATRIFAGKNIYHYEDGQQNKGYIYISDLVEAFILAMEKKEANGKVFNIGLEKPVTIRQIANKLVEKINSNVKVIATGKYRPGDTRHSWPDCSLLKNTLGWQPKISFGEGMKSMVNWLKTLPIAKIKNSMKTFEKAEKFARSYGLEV
jgi:dTDP-L-rhamnose 4-epimerase